MALQRKVSRNLMKELKQNEVDVMVESYLEIDWGETEQESTLVYGRYYGQAPEVDGLTYIVPSPEHLYDEKIQPGNFVNTKIVKTSDYDLVGIPVLHHE